MRFLTPARMFAKGAKKFIGNLMRRGYHQKLLRIVPLGNASRKLKKKKELKKLLAGQLAASKTAPAQPPTSQRDDLTFNIKSAGDHRSKKKEKVYKNKWGHHNKIQTTTNPPRFFFSNKRD